MPAVSRSVTGTPHTATLASTTSRVVPAMSVTIALSLYTLKIKHGFTMVLRTLDMHPKQKKKIEGLNSS